MSAPDEKKTGRRGVGRGRRQQAGAGVEEAPGRGMAEPTSPTTPTAGEGSRGRGRTVAEARPASEGSPEEASPKGSPPTSDVEGKIKAMEIIDLAGRPGFGVVGQKIKVLANHFEVRLDKELNVVQYKVEVGHEKLKLTRDEKRIIFWTCVKENPAVFPNAFRIVYDNDQIMVSLEKLKLGSGEHAEARGNFEVNIRLARMERAERMTIKIDCTGFVHINFREARTTSATGDRYSTPLQIMDLIFRQKRGYPLEESMVRQWYQFQNTVYKLAPGGGVLLTAGRMILQGLFGSTRVGQNFTPFINFDVSHSGFYKPQRALGFLVDILNEHFAGRDKRGFAVEQLKADTTITPQWYPTLQKAFRGLKIQMSVKKQNGELMEKVYTVNDLSKETAISHRFQQQFPQPRMISVAEYFSERYGALQYPNLNLLHVGPKNKKCYLPLEHCMIVGNQRVKKLTPNETSIMIKAAAISAPNRQSKIIDLVKQSGFRPELDPWLKEYGVRVNDQMKQVEARILPPPKIRYSRDGGPRGLVEVRDGTWDMRGQKFFIPGGAQRIGAVILDQRGDMNGYGQFFSFLLNTCAQMGMRVPGNIPPEGMRVIDPNNMPLIEKALTDLKNKGADFIMVIIPAKGCPHYNEVKRVAEIVLGVMTQCVVSSNVRRTMEKNDRMFVGNLALKMNMKMGGINSETEADALARKALLEERTLVLGVDVTHPSPTEKKMPSISSVVGNLDDSFMRYAASIRVQKHRRESIVAGHLDQLVRDRLIQYYQHTKSENEKKKENKGLHPQRIIIYRDGVSEGQFQDVLKEELSGVRQCCRDLDATYKPKITLIVAQKRHHTRFFPTPEGPKCGKADNVKPGTVVDTQITHPEQFEFYLCSHFGIQGTSRPIRYHVLLDENNFSADHMQMMTYYLCHVYARCTRAVSIPAPVYYADLACRRARAHIFDKVSDYSSDTMSQRSGSGGESETQVSEDELIRSSTVKEEMKIRMYFT